MKKIVSYLMACIFSLGSIFGYFNFDLIYAHQETDKRFIMYYGDWSLGDGQGNFVPDHMPADYYTHLNYAFISFNEHGDLVLTDEQAALIHTAGIPGAIEGTATSGLFTAFQRLKQNNPNLKIGISLGGWTKSGNFSLVCADDTKRANLVSQILRFVEYTDMDYVDVDWEYPGHVREPDLIDNAGDEGTPNAGPADRENFIKLLQDLRDGLDKQGERLNTSYELSVALSASPSVLELGTDIPAVFSIVDFANIMTYDMSGAWNGYSGHHTNLYTNPNDSSATPSSIDASVQYFLNAGAPANKIVIGAAYYTRGWEKITEGTEPDVNQPGLYGVAEEVEGSWERGALNELPIVPGDGGWRAGIWSYRNIGRLKEEYGVEEYWDDIAKAPYLYNPTTGSFFTYDNAESVTEKANYVNQKNLGGVIVWMASQDAPDVSGKRNALSTAIYQSLFEGKSLPRNTNEFFIDYSNLEVTVRKGEKNMTVTITNNAEVIDTNSLLSILELRHKTIKLPLITITFNNKLQTIEESFDNTYIAPGESISFTIDNLSNTSSIESIVLGERFSTYDAPFKSQHLPFTFIDDTKVLENPIIPNDNDNSKPDIVATNDNNLIAVWPKLILLSVSILILYKKSEN